MSDIKDKLKRASRRQVTKDVCLRGDLAGEYERLERQLAALPKNNKLGGDPQRQRIEAEMARVRGEMTADTIPFVLRALSESAFQALVDEHPPRRDGDDVNEGDARVGYNRGTFYGALIRACTVEPELDDDDWKLILGPDGMSAGQLVDLSTEASRVNGQAVDVPFSPAGSSVNPD